VWTSVTDGELAALADDELAHRRRVDVEAAVAASPELARRLAVQMRVAAAIRDATAGIEAPEHLRAAIPIAPSTRSTCMSTLSPAQPLPAARRPAASQWWLAARVLGALATLAMGAVHLQQYLKLYSGVPTIGTLFLLNFAGATVLGLALLAPIERVAGRRGGAAVTLAALAAAGMAATSYAFLLISERTPVFGWLEPGYDPPAIAAAKVSEIATVVLLGAFLAARATHSWRSS